MMMVVMMMMILLLIGGEAERKFKYLEKCRVTHPIVIILHSHRSGKKDRIFSTGTSTNDLETNWNKQYSDGAH